MLDSSIFLIRVLPLAGEDRSRARLARMLFPVVLALVMTVAATGARAALLKLNDPALPASADGQNFTRDTVTGLDYLDVDLSAGRTFDDLMGNDGSNEFGPGGDFEGWRHATGLELTGWSAQPQIDSLFKNFGFTSTFSSIGPYSSVRDFLGHVGCFGSCASYGYVYGIFTRDGEPMNPEYAIIEAFASQGQNWGSVMVAGTEVFTPRPVNGPGETIGHFLVRASPLSVPLLSPIATGSLIALLLAAGGGFLRSRN